MLRCVQLLGIPWTLARQALLSMGLTRQEHWSGLPFPPPEELADPGIEPESPALQADSSLSEPPGKPCSHKYGILIKSDSLPPTTPTPSPPPTRDTGSVWKWFWWLQMGRCYWYVVGRDGDVLPHPAMHKTVLTRDKPTLNAIVLRLKNHSMEVWLSSLEARN